MYIQCIFQYMSEKTISVTPSVLYPHKGGASGNRATNRLPLPRLSPAVTFTYRERTKKARAAPLRRVAD
jgi:hypothetical protein